MKEYIILCKADDVYVSLATSFPSEAEAYSHMEELRDVEGDLYVCEVTVSKSDNVPVYHPEGVRYYPKKYVPGVHHWSMYQMWSFIHYQGFAGEISQDIPRGKLVDFITRHIHEYWI